MAINKTISANGSKGHHIFTLYVEETSTSGNDSYLSGSFTLSASQAYWDWAQWGDKITYSVNIGDNILTGSIPQYDGVSVYYLQSFSNIEIPHESDGTKTITISFVVDDETGADYTCGNASASSTMTLSQLHKKPEISSVTVLETGFPGSLSVYDSILVNLLSIKALIINHTVYDDATISRVRVDSAYFSFSFDTNSTTSTQVLCDFSNININYSGSSIYVTVTIIDSLGSADATMIRLSYVNYKYPTITESQSNVKRNGQLTGKAKLNLLGTFANMRINGLDNSIVLKYRYYEYGTTPDDTLEYNEIPSDVYDIDNNSFSIYNWDISKNNVEITDLAKNKSYAFEIILTDSFSNTITNGSDDKIILICSKGEWLMAKFKDRVDFKKITVQGDDPFAYSTEEHRIGTWIDGKPIYRKTFIGTSSAENFIILDIENLSIDIIPNVYGGVKAKAGQWWPISNHYPFDTEYDTSYRYTSNQLTVNLWSQYSYPSYYITIEYTKTTDE